MVVDDEVIVDVGGYIDQGRLIKSWGDPQNVALLPPVSLPALVLGGPRRRSYGDCDAGCGRPTASSKCAVCPVGTYGKGGGICAQCSPGTFGNATVGGAVTPAEACSACPPGRYAPAYGASACVPCVIGTFCEDGWVLHRRRLARGGAALRRDPAADPVPPRHLQPVAGRAVAGVVPQVPGGHRPFTPSAARRSTDATRASRAPSPARPAPPTAPPARRRRTSRRPAPPPARRARPACSRTSAARAVRAVPDRQLLRRRRRRRPDVRRVPRRAVLGFDRRDGVQGVPGGDGGDRPPGDERRGGCVPCANGTFSLAEAATACMAAPPRSSSTTRARRYHPPPDGCPPVDSAAAPLRAGGAHRVAALVCV